MLPTTRSRRSTARAWALMQIAIAQGRASRPDLEVGICGEHGGDPASVGSATSSG